jgi:hypothetical protein
MLDLSRRIIFVIMFVLSFFGLRKMLAPSEAARRVEASEPTDTSRSKVRSLSRSRAPSSRALWWPQLSRWC